MAERHDHERALSAPASVAVMAASATPQVIVICCLALLISGILCAAAGIGGGGIIVSVLMEVGSLSPHDAVPLSKAVVFFGAVVSLILNLRKQLLDPDEMPLINWHCLKLVVPMALVGTLLGVVLNRHVAGWLIVLLLTMVLAVMTGMVTLKTWHQYQEEERLLLERTTTEANTQDPQDPIQQRPSESPPPLLQDTDSGNVAPEPRGSAAWAQLEKADIFLLVSMFLIVVIGSVLVHRAEVCAQEKAGKSLPKNESESFCTHSVLTSVFGKNVGAWMAKEHTATVVQLFILTVPLSAVTTIGMYWGYESFRYHDWPIGSILLFKLVGTATGILAALVGVGGGLIFSPFFLLFGLEPAIAVATSSTCVLFTSSSTTAQYFLTGRILMTLALIYGATNTIASYIGTKGVHIVQDRFFGRRSYISFIVLLAVALSAVLSTMKLVELVRNPENDK